MAKKRGNMICTTECVNCIHSDLNCEKITAKFYCSAKDKHYYYGQYVSCGSKESNEKEKSF